MAFNLLDLVKDQVMGQLSGQASSFLGESEEGVSKALGGIFPTLLASVAGKATEEGGMSGIMDMIKNTDSSMVSNITGLFGSGEGSPEGLMESGSGLLSGLLGDKVGGISSMMSKFAGIKGDSASSLLSMAAPMLMGLIGKKVKSEGMGLSGLQSMLGDQGDFIKAAMPEGLASMMGGSGLLGGLGSMLSGLGDTGMSAVTGAAGIIGDAGKSAVSGAANVAGGAVDAGKKVVGGAADAVTNVAGAVGDTGKKVIGGAANAAGNVAGAVGNAGKNIAGGAANVAGSAVEAGGSLISTILKWAVPILGILIAGYFIKGCMDGKSLTEAATGAVGDTMGAVQGAGDMVGDAATATVGAVGDVAEGAVDAAGTVVGAAGDLVSGAFNVVNDAAKATLDGITFVAGSAGSQFKGFIDGGFKGEGRFRFNNLTFDTGSAKIAGDSGVEVDNIAAIMNAYPEVKINVEGYTDNVGNVDANKALSQARAEAVKARLLVAGINPDRIAAMGFGDANPVADNATAEGKAQNRRIEISIAK